MADVLVSTLEPPLITIVSWTAPTGSVRSSVATAPAPTSMLSRDTVLNPVIDAVSLYLPGGRLRKTYDPFADEVVVRVAVMSAGIEISTVAPGSASLSSLNTVPVSFPSCMDCARRLPTLPPTRKREEQIAVKEALPNCMACSFSNRVLAERERFCKRVSQVQGVCQSVSWDDLPSGPDQGLEATLRAQPLELGLEPRALHDERAARAGGFLEVGQGRLGLPLQGVYARRVV